MAVGMKELPPLHPVAGIRWGSVAAGIKKNGQADLALMEIAPGGCHAALYTRNAFCAAPVIVARRNGGAREPRFLLVNSGNANAGTGAAGFDAAERSCEAVAGHGGCPASEVLPFSTGVIGEPLPVERIEEALPALFESLDEAGWSAAAEAIMTTDTAPKGASWKGEIDGCDVTITGIAKGSGMIHPDMATMLAFVATDAAIAPELLQRALKRAVDGSFNSITVDGDTSTNDACVAVASGRGALKIDAEGEALEQFEQRLADICRQLAQMIVRDGEGATKFITIEVRGGRDQAECRRVAETVALSPLVKTAFFASDPNWGRILAAVGRAGVEGLDIDAVVIELNGVCIVRGGGRAPDYTEEAGQRAMAPPEITVTIDLGRGGACSCLWTCDFSYDYVRINAEYRT